MKTNKSSPKFINLYENQNLGYNSRYATIEILLAILDKIQPYSLQPSVFLLAMHELLLANG